MSVLRSSIVVTFLSLVCGLVSFVNQLVIANTYGASAELDAYFIAISIPLFISGILNGTFAFLLLPILVKFKINNPTHYWKFAGSLLICFFVMALLISVVMYMITPFTIKTIAPTLSGGLEKEAVFMGRFAGVTCGVALLVGYLMVLQNSVQKFILPVIVNSFPYMGMIFFVLFITSFCGVKALVWGMLSGYILAMLILYMNIRKDIAMDFNVRLFKSDIKNIMVSLPLVLVSGLCFAIYGTVDAFWATRLGAGNVSYLNYSQRLIIAIGSLVILGPSTVLAPYFSTQVASGQIAEFKSKLETTIKMIFIFAVPLGLIISVLSTSVVEVVFQGGAFNLQATRALSSLLPGMLFGMIPMVTVAVIYKALYAKNDLRGAALISIVGSVSYFSLSGVLSTYLGIQGIVIAYITAWLVMFCLSVVRIWGRDLKKLVNTENKNYFFNLLVIIVFIGIITMVGRMLIIQPLNEIGFFNLMIRISSIVIVDIILFIIISIYILRMPEVTYFISIFPDKISSKIKPK